MSDINVVPYIDVMLVLLIVFMVTAPLLTQGIKVNLPDTNHAGVIKAQQDPVIVSLSLQGEYFVNVGEQSDTPLNLESLQQVLFSAREARPNVPIFLEGDEAVAYGEVVFLLAALQEAGITRVSLVTEPADRAAGR